MSQLDALTNLNLEDLIAAFNLRLPSLRARALRRILYQPAQRFARHIIRFDQMIGDCGLPEASRVLQCEYVRDVKVYGREHIPSGPILVLSNHPGMTDTTSIFMALGRPDLKIIAQARPFLLALPNLSRQLLLVINGASSQTSLIRKAGAHLQDRGAVLSFPAGRIEPDPDVQKDSLVSLASWSASVGLLVRNAPETAIVPMLVRGVVWRVAARSPLLVFMRGRREKEKLAAALQLLSMMVFGIRPVTVRIQIGKPIYPTQIRSSNAQAIHQAVLENMRYLINNSPEGPGESIL